MGRRSKVPKGRAETYPQPLPFPGIGGRNRSVYLAVCRRDWFSSKPYYPLYKVDVASLRLRRVIPCSQENPSRQAANRRRRQDLRPLQSRWIVGVGGNPSGTVIYDTTKDRVIRGSELVAAKGRPVAATVGYRVYALSSLPNYIGDPDSVPWFEVLDLKDAVITEAAADGSLSLDGCSWERLPSPLCFPASSSPSSSVSAEAGVSHKGGALKLSINVISVKGKEHEEVDANSGHRALLDVLGQGELLCTDF
uniref:Uncharacterized protein n=1 Tax=Setaria viridis TaxID=4556 RepID=A0A4U6WAZ2_SETVI|nr:hypothetical protein SEVIR_1G092300v2 [Setaria viridis]